MLSPSIQQRRLSRRTEPELDMQPIRQIIEDAPDFIPVPELATTQD